MRKAAWIVVLAAAWPLLRCAGKSSASEGQRGRAPSSTGGSAGQTDASTTDADGDAGDALECNDVIDCPSQTDGGVVSFLACDPVTRRCVEPCGVTTISMGGGIPTPDPCGPDRQCMYQQRDSDTFVAACYPPCGRTSGVGCSTGFACTHHPPFQSALAGCVKVGSAAPGEPCASDGCQEGSYCSGAGRTVCRAPCDFWASEPGCVDGEQCSSFAPPARLPGLCVTEPANGGDDAPLGAPCASSNVECGSDGKAWRGFCGSPCIAPTCADRPVPFCLPKCRTNDDCPSDFPRCYSGRGGYCVDAPL